MNTHKRITACLALSVAVFAIPAYGENLLEVFTHAQDSDPEFRAVQAEYDAVVESRVQSRAQAFLPDLRFSGNTTYNQQDITLDGGFGSGGFVEFNSRGWGVSLTQPVYHFSRYLELKQTDLRIAQASIGVSAARQELMTRVAEAFFEVLAAQDSVEFARSEQKALERQLEQTRQRFEVGLIAITDVQEAQAGFDLAVAEEIRALNELDNARDALREITGMYPAALNMLGPDMPLVSPDPQDVEAWTQTALEQNLRMRQALTEAETAEEEIRRQQAQHIPTLDIVGTHGWRRQGGQFGSASVNQTTLGLEVNVPLYQGGQVVSRTREARHRHRAALERLEAQRRSAERQTRNAYLGVISGISRVKALQQAVVSSETAREATIAGFEVGTRTSVDVVTSERNLFRAKRDYARARYDYILNTLRLKHAAGTLSPDDLGEISTWLQ